MLGRTEASKVLQPYTWRFAECWRRAQQRVLDYKATLNTTGMMPRTEASLVYDYMIEEVDREFRYETGISSDFRYGRLTVFVEGVIAMRFKKLTKKLRSSYSATQAARRFFELQLPLDETYYTTNTVCGYRLDAFGNIDGLYYTCPIAGRNAWVLEIDEISDDRQGDVAVLPVTSPTRPIIRPKIAAEEPKENSSEG